MSENKDNKTLIHLGARELNAAESDHVVGGFIVTGMCTIHQATHTYDGDCEPPPF